MKTERVRMSFITVYFLYQNLIKFYALHLIVKIMK